MIWIFCISVWLGIPFNLDKWSSAVHYFVTHCAVGRNVDRWKELTHASSCTWYTFHVVSAVWLQV